MLKHSLKTILAATLLAASISSVALQAQTPYEPTKENLQARKDFSDSRFGIFLHWGIYSTFAQGEWYMQNVPLNREEYAKAADAFFPHRFDADQWVSAIKAAGAKYICFTTRHHDGFSMWDTHQSDYNIMHTPYAKDVVRQLADACHRQGIKLHLYYSHIDWTRDDYPTGRTGRGTGKDPKKENWDIYYRFMNAQLTELLTNYGEIGAIWFDGHWDHDKDSVPFDWQLPEQYELIHRLQPACLVGNNHHITPYPGEDIQIFERDVPGENKAGLSGQAIGRLPLETCQTMNGMWGYKVADQNYKSTTELIRLLVRTAAKGANLLLNVGPQPNGELPATALERMKEMGGWLEQNGEAIYRTQAGGIQMGDSLVSTRRGEVLYLHVLDPNLTEIDVNVPSRIREITNLATGEKMQYMFRRNRLTMPVSVPEDCPDYIIKVEL